MLHVFAQHGDPGVIKLLAGRHALELGYQALDPVVLDLGFVHHTFVVGELLANLGIEDLLLDRGMNGQCLADLRDAVFLPFLVVPQLLEALEQLVDRIVVLPEKVERVLGACFGCLHRRFPNSGTSGDCPTAASRFGQLPTLIVPEHGRVARVPSRVRPWDHCRRTDGSV